ncbi:hypothetical protein F5X68DRAFT_234863 [Plectosphaerella plurivora]|uniref:Uncharacterized protein n=1 Tax=Plectosphaerella plurivora TaxID=936078 RepID=A0A9P8V6Q3_9PEZI|nr:hypothetical protein F5X68DRAFT_234863 [Plectosphaerella plurivora]
MQFSVLTVFAVMASFVAASPSHRLMPRQASTVPVGSPAMSDANGNVVAFDSTKVTKAPARRL